ncbi:facilitated trehalose transporter Tret1-like [Uloborus diversus]|uniref:facilitated trehalose transporter Tret1-like n=1 Tax=Uloborus diversus TaxID=327109 RepID=UPI00240963C4|nr:facilitated trehalose transporter Tret1-like [Uloborus diversus]
MVAGYSAPATADMKKPGSRYEGITEDQITWIASLPNLSGVIGNALSGFISQKLGRKSVLMYISLSFMTSWLLIAYSRSLLYVYAGLLISGFSAGIASVAVPAYVVEIATTEKRGFLTSGFQVFYSLGVLVMMSLGIVLSWSWLAITAAIFVVSGASLMFFMPESPAWLVRESRCAEAIRGLMFLRGKNVDYVREIEEINDSMRKHSSRGIRFQDFLKPTLYKPIVIVFLLFFFQQFSGVKSLMSYTVDILKSAGSAIDPLTAAAIVSVVQLLVTVTSCLLMDRAGRKVLFIVSGCFLFLSLTTLGLHSIAVQKYNFDQEKYGWVPVMAFVVYVAAYAIGFGPIPFVMTPELVPINTRSFLLAMGSVTCSGLGFVVAKSFDSLKTLMGEYGLYWGYAAFSLLGSLYCFFFIQETKGRTIQEINNSFSASS